MCGLWEDMKLLLCFSHKVPWVPLDVQFYPVASRPLRIHFSMFRTVSLIFWTTCTLAFQDSDEAFFSSGPESLTTKSNRLIDPSICFRSVLNLCIEYLSHDRFSMVYISELKFRWEQRCSIHLEITEHIL